MEQPSTAISSEESRTTRLGGDKYSQQQDFSIATNMRRVIRKQLYEELIGEAFGESYCALELHCDTGSFGGSEYLGTLADWLKAKRDRENG